MGQVFLAMTGASGFESLCVLKRVLPEARTRREYVARFKDEAKLVRALKHPGLAQTHAVLEVEGELVIVQEFIDGQDLADVAYRAEKEGRPLSVGTAVHIAREVARALRYAHESNVVHRDISPVNIRITYSGEVKLLDFGLALSALKSEWTMQGQWGKQAYMAPEQLAGEKADARTDLYVLGAVLWELLTGRLFADRQQSTPSACNPKVAASLDQVVMKAISADRGQRYATAAAFEEALTPFIAEEPEATLKGLMAVLYDTDAERRQQQDLLEQGRRLPAEAVTERVDLRKGRSAQFGLVALALLAVVGTVFVLRRQPSSSETSAPQGPALGRQTPVPLVPSFQPTSPSAEPKASGSSSATARARDAIIRPPTPVRTARQRTENPSEIDTAVPRRPRQGELAEDPAQLIDRGWELVQKSDAVKIDKEEALRLAKIAVERSQSAAAYHLAGFAAKSLGRYTVADEYFEHAISLNPSNVEQLRRLREKTAALRDAHNVGSHDL
jgi:serine/threonine-protein kinase